MSTNKRTSLWPVLLVTALGFFMIMLRPTVAVAVVVLAMASVSWVLVLNRRQLPDVAVAPVNVADAA
jgi:hypothetical protein